MLKEQNTGFFLVLGVITLAVLPNPAFCRPVDETGADKLSKQFHVYVHSSDDSSPVGLLTSPSRRGSSLNNDEDEENNGSRFEFRRKIPYSSSNKQNVANINYNRGINDDDDSKAVHSLGVFELPNKNKDNSFLDGNSSMIVHVIVTSSSSTSGGSLEYDETDNDSSRQDSGSIPEDNFQYTVSEDGDGSLVAEPSSDSHVSTAKSSSDVAASVEEHQDFNKSNSNDEDSSNPPKKSNLPQSFHIVDGNNDEGMLELKKLPKSQNDSPDIFSAFYRAFSQMSPPSSSPPPKVPSSQMTPGQQDKSSLFPGTTTTDSTITTFKLSPRSDFRQRPSSFQLFQQRRRLYRHRQFLERKPSTVSPEIVPQKSLFDGYAKDVSDAESSSVEETSKKLEYLAKKLEKSEQEESFRGQQDKILTVSSSSSSSLITTTQVPFLLSQSSITASSFPPPKIAVSVTHTKSVVASAAATSAVKRVEEAELTKQEVVRGEVKKNAKSETAFPVTQEEREKNHGTYSFFTQPRPLIKSLLRNEDGDQQNENINNKNRSNNRIFPRNFSTHDREEYSILRKSYGSSGDAAEGTVHGNGKSAVVEINSSNNHNEKVNGDNFRNQDRFNIISLSRDGVDSTLSSELPKASAFTISSQQPFRFIDVTTFRPSTQRRKITRTISSEAGDPSSYFFNANLSNRSTVRSPSKVPVSKKPGQSSQSTPKPAVNWQQPEKIWSEPAQVWGVPAKVWGEPARVWSEPAQVWGHPEKIWAKKLEDEIMQSDQPPEDRKADDGTDPSPQGTFVILGDDENEGDSIDGDLGRPLTLHHFTIPQNKHKETVSVSTSVSSSVSSNNKNVDNGGSDVGTGQFTRNVASSQPLAQPNLFQQADTNPSSIKSPLSSSRSEIPANSDSNSSSSDTGGSGDQQTQNKKSGKKFGYVIEGANVRKYRVEERTPDGYIVGEYGVLNNQNAFLRGVRYTADGTINPRLIHEALMKFLSLRR